jgi:hypothetical protein
MNTGLASLGQWTQEILHHGEKEEFSRSSTRSNQRISNQLVYSRVPYPIHTNEF